MNQPVKEKGKKSRCQILQFFLEDTSGNYISTVEAGELLRVSSERVRQLIKAQEIKAIKVNRYSWLILTESVYDYQRRKAQEKERRMIIQKQRKIERREKAKQKRALERKASKGTVSCRRRKKEILDSHGDEL